jgi:hypothetical protein
MAIKLFVNGYFDVTFFYLNGKQVGEHKDKDIEQGILDNLEQGEYIISLAKREVYDINAIGEVLYTFEIDPTDAMEYQWDEKEGIYGND